MYDDGVGRRGLRLAMAQLNLRVGDVAGNLARLVATAIRARDEFHADGVIFPELALTGYPPEDLLFRRGLLQTSTAALEALGCQVQGIYLIVGHPHPSETGLYNGATVLYNGRRLGTYYKHHLPNYAVFDEKRYFIPGTEPLVVEIAGVRVGITICEDVWQPGPVGAAVAAGAQVLVNLNASPYHLGKAAEREAALRERVAEGGIPLVYVNLVGGQDELVFDGESLVMNQTGQITQRAASFQEALSVVELAQQENGQWAPLPGPMSPTLSVEQSVYQALMLGMRDYVYKNGFRGVVLGLSGGVDSALTLAIAADALGADRVQAVMMPSRYTANMSLDDARAEAEALGVRYRVLPISNVFHAFLDTLAADFTGLPPDLTEENIQARCRGVLLMAISNKHGSMVLTTGNKSEMAVGYATLYGDMAGGFAVIKDVPKTLVYRLARYRNKVSSVIPERVLTRPPSAELRPDQKDEDSLPPYDVLDPLLALYVEQERCPAEIIAAGFDPVVVARVVQLVDRAEYKRRQAPPGVRISRLAFGRDRRYPISSGFRHTVTNT